MTAQRSVACRASIADQRSLREATGEATDFRFQRLVCNHAVDQAEARRFGGIDRVGEEEKLLGFGGTGAVGEQPGRSEIAAIRDLRPSRTETRPVGSDPKIASQAGRASLSGKARRQIPGTVVPLISRAPVSAPRRSQSR